MEKLIDVIRRSDFEPKKYNGSMQNDFQFVRLFPINAKMLSEAFELVNSFLLINGFEIFSYQDFEKDLSVKNDRISIYADQFLIENDRKLVLIIEKYCIETNPLDAIIYELAKFRNERDWDQFHNPKDLALAINVEAGELLELFLWKDSELANKERIKEELADVFAFAFLLAEKYDFNVKQIILDKIKSNGKKYPVDKAKGTSKKYNEL